MALGKRVLFLPDWREGNPYLSLLAGALEKQGYCVQFDNFKSGPFALQSLRRAHPDNKIFHIHWIDDLIASLLWPGSRLKREVLLWLLGLDVLLLRLFGVRVVWTIHNIVSHESRDPEFEKRVRRMIARTVSKVIIHSKRAADMVTSSYGIDMSQKTAVIPHGNYVGYYQPIRKKIEQLRDELGLRPNDFVLLFFGAIRPYKGVKGLLNAFSKTVRPDIRLLIAGKCWTRELEEDIISASKLDPRIVLRLEFVPEEDVAQLFAISDAVILPFQKILTSGSAVLAMSQSRALLLPDNAHVLEFGDEGGVGFYPRAAALPEFLDGLDKEQMHAMGSHNLGIVSKWNWVVTGEKTAALYGTQSDAPGHLP